MGILGDETDIAALKLEMNDFLERYFNMPPSRLRLGELIHEVFNASLRHQIHTPPAFLMLGKTVATVESVVMTLNPDFDILKFSQPHIAQFLVQNFGLNIGNGRLWILWKISQNWRAICRSSCIASYKNYSAVP